MTATYLFLSALAALGFYLASAHQRFWPGARAHARALRAVGWITTVLATAAAIVDLGLWAGVFAALTMLMLALVLLPHLDAWRQLARARSHVARRVGGRHGSGCKSLTRGPFFRRFLAHRTTMGRRIVEKLSSQVMLFASNMSAAHAPRYLAAALLGLPLTVGVIGLIALAWPGDQTITTLPWVMMTFPVWVALMTLAFVFRSAWRAWFWLGGATVASFVLLYGLKALGWLGVQA